MAPDTPAAVLPVSKRKYTDLTIRDAMLIVPAREFTTWDVTSAPVEPGVYLREAIVRLDYFDLVGSEAAKLLLIDAVLLEILPRHGRLKAWKGEPIETDTLTGFVDYLIAPKRAYLEAPLLCIVEAKKDDFESGEIQCVAEMAACRWNNTRAGIIADVYGMVSNGDGWQFYALRTDNTIHKSRLFAIGLLPELLGVVDAICAECARHVAP